MESDKHLYSGENKYKAKPVATASVLPRIVKHATKQNHGFIGKPAVQSRAGWKPMAVTSETYRECGNRGNNVHVATQNRGFIGQPAVQSGGGWKPTSLMAVTDCENSSNGINVHSTTEREPWF